MGIVRRLSAEEVMKVAKATLIQNCVDPSMPKHVFGLSHQETTDVELACLLLASAEKVAKQEHDEGRRLLNLCDFLSSRTGSSVQRTVHYFTKALQERIAREAGRNEEEGYHHSEETMAYGNPTIISCFLHLPFSQVTQFAGIQAIVESVTSVKRVHYIDLAIRSGAQCIVLMQALATRHECPIELLEITAVGTSSKQKMEETGKGLARFAEALNLPFSFQITLVRDIQDLNKDVFQTQADEVVAIYSPVLLNHMIRKPRRLESLLKVVRELNPCVMVVIEADTDHNSPNFLGRFNDALLSYSAYFECLEVFMDRSDPNRMTMEDTYLSRQIRNIVATEGEDRVFRRMKIEAWRNLFSGFSMVEQELSMSSLHQAELLVKSFACGSSCTLYRNGKCLTIGWKGRSFLSVSA